MSARTRRRALVGDAVGAVGPADHRTAAGGRGVGGRDDHTRHRDVGAVERLRVVEDLPGLGAGDRLERRRPDELARLPPPAAGRVGCRTRGRSAPCAATPSGAAARRCGGEHDRQRTRRARSTTTPRPTRCAPRAAHSTSAARPVHRTPVHEHAFHALLPARKPEPAPSSASARRGVHLDPSVDQTRAPRPARTVRTTDAQSPNRRRTVRGQGPIRTSRGSSGRFRGFSPTRFRSTATWRGAPVGPPARRTGPGWCSSTGR